MCWCQTCLDTSNDAYDNRICPCGEESPCRFHGGPDPYANQGEHDRCSWAGCAAGKPLACPKRAGNSGGPFADLTENQRRQIREAQASAKKGGATDE